MPPGPGLVSALSQLVLPPQHSWPIAALGPEPLSWSLTRASLAPRLLLQAGYDPELRDGDGWTPLHAAAHWGVEDACRLLAEHGGGMDSLTHAVSAAWGTGVGLGAGGPEPSSSPALPLPPRGSGPVTWQMRRC